MEWLMYYLATCWIIACMGLFFEDFQKGAKLLWKDLNTVWNYISGYLYDLGADLEGIEPCSKEEDNE